MYYKFDFFRDAQRFIEETENAKLMSWHGPYMVCVPIAQQRRK